MKKIFFAVIMIIIFLGSCDYLDVVPEGTASQKDIFKTPEQAESFVYSLYQFMPNLSYKYAPGILGGDDIISSPVGATRYFQYKSLIYSNDAETPSNTYFAMWGNKVATGGTSYDLFKGVRYCYMLLNNIDKVPGMREERIKRAKGNAYFCIGYYHMTSLFFYGPTMIIDKELSLNDAPTALSSRASYDECVAFIVKMFDAAAEMLPAKEGSEEVGMATSVAAKAFKARLLLYAASPLVNGNNEFYSDFKNNDGKTLMNLVYDPNKWEKARIAAKEAIDLALSSGYSLYEDLTAQELPDSERGKKNYRGCFLGQNWNEQEFLFAKGDQGGIEGLQRYCGPRTVKNDNSGFCPTFVPTFSAVELYYTKNGLPLDKDPLTKDLNLYEYDPVSETAFLNINREPRFYACIGFDRGTYEVNNSVNNVIKARAGELQGSTRNLKDEYQSCTGYYLLKWFGKETVYNSSTRKFTYAKFAFPYSRLSELYLSYAEADFEYNGKLSSLSLSYLNEIRKRAGLPTFEKSWGLAGGIPKGEELRKVLHQERSIELLFEGMRYHDLRRWKEAEKAYRQYQKSWNLEESSPASYYTITEMRESGTRNFTSPRSYWLAIPLKEIENNPSLVQNPGY